MKVFGLALISFLGCSSFCQAEVTFHEGVVVLRTGVIVSGKISVASFQLALVEIGDTRQVYPSHLIDKIRFYDEEHSINRQFVSVSSDLTKEFSLYEKIVAGAATVMRKPKSSTWQSTKVTVLDHEQFEYYVMWNGEIVPINKTKKAFFDEWNIMISDQLASYVKEVHLNLYDTADLIRLIQYYNQSVRHKPLLAGL
ncbi:MAG: hypothetical protein KDC93_00535 [Cyclobacteriaceae bacterium]|nr:hypothetical protein [Cyclobacteriaceae bacterium]